MKIHMAAIVWWAYGRYTLHQALCRGGLVKRTTNEWRKVSCARCRAKREKGGGR